MDIENLDKISKLIDLCRKKGVKTLKCGEFSLELGSDVPESPYKQKLKIKETESIKDPTEPLSDLDKALWWSTNNVAEGAQ